MKASGQRMLKRQIKRIDVELKALRKERQQLEAKGCFSDRELTAKDAQLAEYDRRIQTLELERNRLQMHYNTGGGRE
jgi:ABC-type phosphate transport system auxiliary subunit